MNAIEEEVIFLLAAIRAIDSMVNRALFEVSGVEPNRSILFHTPAHQQLFNLLLSDFLSKTDRKSVVKQEPYLGAIRNITSEPGFEPPQAAIGLREATVKFVKWLEQTVEVNTWLPSIEKDVVLAVTRLKFLKMCGNLSKHNFLRAIGVAEELKECLDACDVTVTTEESLLAFDDFYARFHSDILNYHASTIAEFLNNIRWGIYHYLRPEFSRSIVWPDGKPPNYHFTFPPNLETDFARTCYLELMNEVRVEPIFAPFTVTRSLKSRY